jgi:hypothetical protein
MKTTTAPSATISAEPVEPIITQTASTVRFKLASLSFDPAFTPRKETAKAHVHDLARALRVCGDLDPVLVWLDARTGSMIILDGRHRVAAYRFCKIATIPAIVFQGSRKDARLEAARVNSKTTFPWSTSECTQYAWGLVIEEEASKREVSTAAKVSIGTVTNMRKRLAELKTLGETPTGNWWRDRNDKQPEGKPEDDSDSAKHARIAKLREWFHGAETRFKIEFGRRFTPDEFGIAARWHLGQARFKVMASGGCLIDEDEFSTDPELRPIDAPIGPATMNSGDDF